MPTARCLDELRRIRDANRDWIAAVTGNLGTALGFKGVRGAISAEPAVLFFVEGKLPAALVPACRAIPRTLFGPDGLSCATDVVVGRRSGGLDGVGGGRYGRVFHPDPAGFRLGVGPCCGDFDSIEDYLDRVAGEEDAYFRVDRAFAELFREAAEAVVGGVGATSSGGDPTRPRLEGLRPLGRGVVHARATDLAAECFAPRGTVAACDYEWSDGRNSLRADYLIRWDGDRPLSGGVRRGNLLVADDGHGAPVALAWSGYFAALRRGLGQDVWDYALDIDTVLGWQLERAPLPRPSRRAMPSLAPAAPCRPVRTAPLAAATVTTSQAVS